MIETTIPAILVALILLAFSVLLAFFVVTEVKIAYYFPRKKTHRWARRVASWCESKNIIP